MKVNYGIYLGVSSSSIAKMEDGMPVILKSDTLKDRMPVCIYFNKKGAIQVGDRAFTVHKTEIIKSQKDWSRSSNNSFVEFTRTLGSDKTYYSTNTSKSFTSTELVAEIIKTLISFEKSKDVNAAVITVPAAFKNNQKEAVREAGKLAGLQQVEILQEPIAATMAYGLDSIKFQGFSLVFSFDDVFDVSLMKNNRITDNEGDSYLGGENLDFAIVDEIIIPYLQGNFVIDFILADDIKIQILRSTLQFYAEEAKKKLSYNEKYEIYSDLGELGEDDEGEEIELDITITQTYIKKALSPIFQKAIDVSKSLLERNNFKGTSLDSLILIGGSTLSPVLRTMLEEQICKPDTSIDPKTAIAKGAALYASTIDVSEEAKEQTRDKTKIQLEIANESSTTETEEFVPIKILTDKTEREIPKKVFVEIVRDDQAWSSGKIEINTIGEVVEIQLNEGKTNIFEVILFDDKGNVLESEPSTFSVIQGTKIGSATLAYNIGTEIKDKTTGKIIFRTIKGLEKNQSIPAVGTYNGIKTEFPIRPGMESDFIKIPIYEGDHAADGTRAIYNEHVLDVIISGADLPTLLPENSDVALTISVDKSERITVTAYFPYLDFTYEASVERTISSIETDWLANEIRKAKGSISKLKQGGNSDSTKLQKIESELEQLDQSFENNKNDIDYKQEVLTNLRRLLKLIDNLYIIHIQREAINEKYDREILQLFEVGEATIKEVIKGLEDANRQNGIVYKEVIEIYKNQKINVTKEKIETLLFKLTEDEILPGDKFGIYYEKLSDVSDNSSELNNLYNEIKSYE